MRGGFTLVEVVLAALVLEIGLLGVVGTLLVASRIQSRVETHERRIADVESLVDALDRGGALPSGSEPRVWGDLAWWEDGPGRVRIRAVGPEADTLWIETGIGTGEVGS